ncbi:FAD-binding oxidoreductase [Spirosoma sp. KNUC1025]|uniref:FAD-binding oxidoreductase n=1 Tax=Spirosoma sp. KNUC1025 TaxID=2894082 RepID=UPI00386F1F03|nr:FAD-binding oxidoreductase [Spirosoma sp. KNUC1025]
MTQSPASDLLAPEAITELKAKFKGVLLRRGEEGYDQARAVWNGMIDKCPALIARCTSSADVVSAVRFAQKHDLLVSVRGGGHNVAGNAVCADGLMIDLSPMKAIQVDVTKRTARAEAGVLWSELDQATQQHGLATTGGTVSHTGIAGLTLGGGLGWLMGKHGLACDNLLSVEIVLANGEVLTASETTNEDLFWAVRGGGGNFGIVTSFEYQLHPVGPTVVGGMILYPQNQAKDVLRFYRDFARSTPDELMVFAALLNTPDGMPVIALLVGWFGPLSDAEHQLKPLREFGTPLADLIAEVPYLQHQAIFDAATPHGMPRYWKSGNLPEIQDDFIEIVTTQAARQPSPFSFILFFHIKGAAARVDSSKTAFGLREDQWDFDIVSQWMDPADAQTNIDWTRTFWSQVEPFTKGVYVNHLGGEDEATRVRAAYGPNYERLVALKTKYDPENFLRLNNNIVPNSVANSL